MTSDNCAACPVRDGACRSYPVLCGRLATNPAAYLPIVESLNRAAPPSEYPPLATQAGNALAAVGRFVGSGCATVDRAEFERRRSICMACPHRDPEQDRCRLCACYLAVKPWSKAEKCPDGRWETPGPPATAWSA